MRVRISFILLVLALVGCVPQVEHKQVQLQPCSVDCGLIEGRISDKDTGDPIVGASIAIVGTMTGTQTNLYGQYEILRLEPGTYTVRVSAVGYSTLEITDIEVRPSDGIEVSYALEKKSDIGTIFTVQGGYQDPLHGSKQVPTRDEIMSGVATGFESVSTGSITGLITDSVTGEPVAGASIAIIGTTKSALTGINGIFIVTDLRPLTYMLRISSRYH